MAIYLISDLHLGHENIINYCNRPFSSVKEMNNHLISNWNETISSDDAVFFIGDLSMSPDEETLEYLNQLNGNIVWIRGNHDSIDSEDSPIPIVKSQYFTFTHEKQTYEFWATHWPPIQSKEDVNNRNPPHYSQPPKWFNGWVIHGHTHNNDMDDFPHINYENKYINVSCEVIDYTPIKLKQIINKL